MISLDTRARDLLINILESRKQKSVYEISEENELTFDGLNHTLHRIDVWLNIRGIAIEKSKNGNVFIEVTEYERCKLLDELRSLHGYSLILSAQERQLYISLVLLTEKHPILSKAIAFELGVSRPTVLNDIDQVEEWLGGFNIQVIRKPGTGFFIEGKESDIRDAIEFVLYQTLNVLAVLSICHGENKNLLSHYPEQSLIKLPIPFILSKDILVFSGNSIFKIEEEQKINYSDNAFFSLVIFLYITIIRNREGYYLDDFELDDVSLVNSKQYRMAKIITDEINLCFNISIKEAEILKIAMRLLGAKPRQSTSIGKSSNVLLERNELLESLIVEMVSEASKLLHPILAVDQKLIDGLLIHLKPAINRLLFNVPIQNKLLPDIKENYPYIYFVAEKCVSVLEEKYNLVVSEEEIGFITMHLGAAMERLSKVTSDEIRALVVCGGGCATAYMLMSRINAEFPKINIVDVSSLLELTEQKIISLNIELIITTVPLGNLSIPTLLVSPLLNDNDRKQIKNYLSTDKSNSHLLGAKGLPENKLILRLLSDETIQINVSAIDWYDAVDQACLPLLLNNSIRRKYVSGIKELLETHGPYMVIGQHVVLLHAMIGYGVNELCLSMTTFSQPVIFGHKYNDPVSLGIVFGTVGGEAHFQLLSQLNQLLGDQNIIHLLVQQKTTEEFYQIIRKVLS